MQHNEMNTITLSKIKCHEIRKIIQVVYKTHFEYRGKLRTYNFHKAYSQHKSLKYYRTVIVFRLTVTCCSHKILSLSNLRCGMSSFLKTQR